METSSPSKLNSETFFFLKPKAFSTNIASTENYPGKKNPPMDQSDFLLVWEEKVNKTRNAISP